MTPNSLLLLLACLAMLTPTAPAQHVLLEAEQFADTGGWDVDQQSMDLTDKPFPGRRSFKGQWAGAPLDNLGGWFWESGFDKDQINDLERIRDWDGVQVSHFQE